MPEDNRAPGSPLPASDLLAAQNLVLEMIASGAPLDQVLRALAAYIDREAGMCSIFLLDPDGSTLRLAASEKLPRTLVQEIDGFKIAPDAGACGAAVYRRERVIVEEIATDPLFASFRDLFLAHGLHSCWSTPIRARDGGVLGTVAVYDSRQRIPRAQEMAYVDKATELARIAIERRQTEGRLRDEKDKFRALIENTSDIVAIIDENGVIRYLNPAVERVLGFHASELLGTSGADSIAFQQALGQPGVSPRIEQRFLHKDGSWRVLETIANNQLHDPAIGGVIVTARDITLPKSAEAELLASQEQYRELFENANDIIFTHDLAGTMLSLNKAGELLLGYRREELLGSNYAKFVAPESRALSREMLDRKLGGEARTVYELECITKLGVRFPVEMSSRLIFRLGRPVAVQGVARDITERRRLESQLSQSHRMEAIGRLAGGVAHDFNNLLTVVAGYSRWLLDDLPPDSPFTESASEILLAANRAAVLTNQLLAFSRNQVIQPIVVDLNHAGGGAGPDAAPRDRRGHRADASMSPDLGLVKADPGQIEQVILNLVINARDAMPPAARFWSRRQTSKLTRACPNAAGLSSGSLRHAGGERHRIGLDEQVRAHIFEPFFTTKETGKGTGLGLSTVYGIVKQGGGYIDVESEPGAGAVFRVYFPRVADGALPSEIAHVAAAGAAPKRSCWWRTRPR